MDILSIKPEQLTKEQRLHIGDLLGYTEQAASNKCHRFILGCQGKLKNWDYDEVINFGEMGNVIAVLKYIEQL